MRYCTPFALYLTSSYCPQNNGPAIGFRRCGAPKSLGHCSGESREGWKVIHIGFNVTFIFSLLLLGPVWRDTLIPLDRVCDCTLQTAGRFGCRWGVCECSFSRNRKQMQRAHVWAQNVCVHVCVCLQQGIVALMLGHTLLYPTWSQYARYSATWSQQL